MTANVVLILCRTCRKKRKCSGDKSYLDYLENQLASYFTYLCLRPEMLEKGDGVQTTRVLTWLEVHLLMSGEGPAYSDVDRIVKNFGLEDRL